MKKRTICRRISEQVARLLPLVYDYNLDNKEEWHLTVEYGMGASFGYDLIVTLWDTRKYRKTQTGLESRRIIMFGGINGYIFDEEARLAMTKLFDLCTRLENDEFDPEAVFTESDDER